MEGVVQRRRGWIVVLATPNDCTLANRSTSERRGSQSGDIVFGAECFESGGEFGRKGRE